MSRALLLASRRLSATPQGAADVDAFDPSFFSVAVTFAAADPGSEAHADALNTPGAGAVLQAYVEPFTDPGVVTEAGQPVSKSYWSVFTPTDPGVGLEDSATWGGRTRSVWRAPSDQTSGAGLLWRTVCEEVT